MLQKRKGMQSDEERQINCIDRCCSSNYYDHLDFRVRKTNNTKSWSFLGFTAKFLCLFSFLFLVGIVMDGTKHIMGKGWENFLRNYLVEFVSTLGAAGVLFGEFHAIQDTSLNDVVDRIYINVKDLPFQSLGALANILSDIKKGLIQDSHIWSFFQSFFKQYQLIISLNQIYQFVYLSLMEIMSYLHFDYWKKTARSGASMNKENKWDV